MGSSTDSAAAAAGGAAAESGPPPRPQLVVLAEDSPDVQGIVRHALEADGCRVIVVADGAEAMRVLQEHEPDLLVLDLMMPRMSGVEVLRELRESGRLERLPVLVLTARSTEDDIVACLNLGASDYVTKPFMLRELRARARALLARERAVEHGGEEPARERATEDGGDEGAERPADQAAEQPEKGAERQADRAAEQPEEDAERPAR